MVAPSFTWAFACGLLREQFLATNDAQKIAHRLPCKLHIGRQVAIERMRNLIGVVADAAELGE